MNIDLFTVLKSNRGKPLTPEICADIMLAADQLTTLVSRETIEKVNSVEFDGIRFALECIEDITEEIKPLHQAHWNETEEHRHTLPFNMDYETFYQYERAGRYVLFTLRHEGKLMGNCAMYLSVSTHTQTLLATEDTLYFLPEARRGSMARRFIAYCEKALRQIGVVEIQVSVKTVNKAGRFFQMLGYRHVENGLTKVFDKE